MTDALLVLICLLLVVLITVIYQMIIEVRRIPTQIASIVFASLNNKIKKVSNEIKKIRDDMGMD